MFSDLTSAHIIKTGKLYFHVVFLLSKNAVFDVIFRGLVVATILVFLFPDWQRRQANLKLILPIWSFCVMERTKHCYTRLWGNFQKLLRIVRILILIIWAKRHNSGAWESGMKENLTVTNSVVKA
jgi:hypothetical protein